MKVAASLFVPLANTSQGLGEISHYPAAATIAFKLLHLLFFFLNQQTIANGIEESRAK